jgi:hypothetical protein
MDKLPFPKSRPAVRAAVLLTIIGFLLYYSIGFPLFLKIYEDQFQLVPYVNKVSPSQCEGLEVKLQIPKTVFSNGVQYVYLNVKNTSNNDYRNITLQFVVDNQDTQKQPILLPRFFEKNISAEVLNIGALPPGFSATGRLLISLQGEFTLDEARIKISCERAVAPGQNDQGTEVSSQVDLQSSELTPAGNIIILKDNLSSLLHSVLENVLLPPWSNGLIPTLVIFFCWMFEPDEKDSLGGTEKILEKDNRKNFWGSFLAVFTKSFIWNIIFWIVLYLAVRYVWIDWAIVAIGVIIVIIGIIVILQRRVADFSHVLIGKCRQLGHIGYDFTRNILKKKN